MAATDETETEGEGMLSSVGRLTWVSAADPERQQYTRSWMCVSLSVTRFAMYDLQAPERTRTPDEIEGEGEPWSARELERRPR